MEFYFVLVVWDRRILLHTRQLHPLGILHELVAEMNNGNSRRGLLVVVAVAAIVLVVVFATVLGVYYGRSDNGSNKVSCYVVDYGVWQMMITSPTFGNTIFTNEPN